MKIGLKPGAQGAGVQRLHRVLTSAGLSIQPAEAKQREFGPSTLSALRALQQREGLAESDRIDAPTHAALLVIEEAIAVPARAGRPSAEGGARAPSAKSQSAKPAAKAASRGTVEGTLVDEDGSPVAGARITLLSKQVRGETRIGGAVTNPQGHYAIRYRRPGALNLMVRAADRSGKLIATSATVFAAPATTTIDFTTAADAVVRTPSILATLEVAVSTQLHGTPLRELQENSKVHELTFLASAIDMEFDEVAYLYMAQALGAANGIRPATFFGIFYGSIPPTLDAALGSLPDDGIDAAFLAQVLNGVLGHSRSSLSKTLSAAVGANVLPASYAKAQDSELTLLDALRAKNIGSTPFVRGKTPLNDILAAGNVSDAVKTAFIQTYAANNRQAGPTWKALDADKNLAAADIATLKNTLSLGELFNGNIPLIQDALGRLSTNAPAGTQLAGIPNLALLDENDWITRITAIDPEAKTISQVIPTDTAEQRIARFAKALSSRLASRYPSMAFAGGLSKTQTTFLSATKAEIGGFLIANPTLSLKATNLDRFLQVNKTTLSDGALTDLKTAQRLFRISPHFSTVEALHLAGHTSAQSVYFTGRGPFIEKMTTLMGSPSLAKMAYARSHMTYATALTTFGRYNSALNGIYPSAFGSPTPPPTAIANLPDLQALFGSLDFFACEDCQSVYSPAAYLVDLLQYLRLFKASGGGVDNARDALLQRRPDIQYTALNCNNTNVTLPYIDLVNEVLEAAIAPPATPVTLLDTAGTTAERRALPQNVSAAAYQKTADVAFPLNLPFDLAFAQTTAYINALGTSRAAILALFAENSHGPSAAAIAAASLGINPRLWPTIAGTSNYPAWDRWGFAEHPAFVIDPKTNAAYSPNPTDWVAALSKVPVLLNRAGLSLQQLYQLLEVVWVTQSSVTLAAGTTTTANLQVLSADTDAMQFTGLDGNVLDRANRFLRLWTSTGLQMWELDWALGYAPAAGNLNDAFLIFLSRAISVQAQLKLPFQEVLSFWMPLETRDVTNHLGDEDSVAASTYTNVFRNPAVLASAGSVFVPAATGLSGARIVSGSDEQNAITASLGLSADDVAAILTFTATPNTLSLETLNVLLQYRRLSSALALTVPDLILWIQLTGKTPCGSGSTPADTLAFLRRLAVLQGTGIAVHDLDYLLRGQSASQSSLGLTATQSTAVLQAVRDAVAKLPGATAGPFTADPAAIQTIVVNALATATGTTANVVTPVLLKTAVLPLSAATLSQLVAQNSAVNPEDFPALVNAVTSVGKAAALFTALAPTETEFTFVVDRSAAFAWLDPSALPLTPVTDSPYTAFEALVRALQLDRRQTARTPKLFDVLAQWLRHTPIPLTASVRIASVDVSGASNSSPIAVTTATPHNFQTGMQVTISGALGNTALNGTFTIVVRNPSVFDLEGSTGNGAWTGGGTIVAAGLAHLALALNAGVTDFLSVAEALGATPPSFIAHTRAGSLADMAMLASIAAALDVVARYSISGATLVQLAAAPATASTAAAAMGALQAQYSQSAWFGAIQPVEDVLRQNRRDALVAYLLGSGPSTAAPPLLLTTDDIFNYYLIDPEMAPCAQTTRLLQASLAIQQFMQQCFLNVSFSNISVDMSDQRLCGEWSWRQQYRLWQANREVFLYPENYLLPETRRDASSFFSDLENDLRQSDCDADAAEAALENYLRKLVGVARLQVAAHVRQTMNDGSTVLHVFAHTRANPPQWYYRTRTEMTPGIAGSWTAWQSLKLDIASQQLLPVIWDQRLYLVWPIFKQLAEKQGDQGVPAAGGPSAAQSPAETFWAIEFAMSELSAGQWQAKRTLNEKMFFSVGDVPPLAFTFRAFEDSSGNLKIQLYSGTSIVLEEGTLPMPDAPLSVSAAEYINPPAEWVDLGQEPSHALVGQGTSFGQLAMPSGYGYSGQDLVFGDYTTANPGTQVLNVLSAGSTTNSPSSVELLATINNPRMVIQAQSPVFDATDPFFVSDPTRTYLLQPEYYTVSSPPQELTNLKYVSQWNTRFSFQTFYHPYAQTFLRELEIGGIPQLLNRNLQVNPQTVRNWSTTFDFNAIYQPQQPVVWPYPGDFGAEDPGESALDFAAGSSGAYALYNWEVFYHAPMFVASLLMQNQKYQDAMTWLEYIFNPTDSSGGPAPERFWQMAPLNALNSAQWISQEISNTLTQLAADTQQGVQGISDRATIAAIQNWVLDPFDPHAIASLRIAAYGKATVMKFLDNLIAWGDWYYSQYTAEKVSQAEQLYILADMILGPRPQMLRLPNSSQSATPPATYASLSNIDAFSNVLVNIENIIVAPEPPPSIVDGTAGTPSLPQFPGGGNTLLFCIPPNDQLLAYWDTVSQRLYNIRHCLNLQGVAQPLPLYAPAINPLLQAEAAANGGSVSGAAPSAPIYRFAVYLQKAMELTNDVRAYGALILSALEKQDSETLAVLRANQELDIQTRLLDVKTSQVSEAQDQITALQNQQAVVQIRYNFYSTVAFMNAWETAAIALQGGALISNGLAVILDATSGGAHLVPSVSVGVSGFGGTPTVTMSYGGENVASATASWASVARGIGGLLGEAGSMSATLGAYQRRMDEWTLQANLANAELTQMSSQIAAATDRLNTAQKELEIQNVQISNNQAVADFMTGKYTNAQLYNWMVTQLTTVYTQAYQLAFSLALQAQNAYQYELGSSDTFIQFGYWDSQHKGLTAGESLQFDLRRMEAQYLAGNSREMELTKHISLALSNPLALVMLRETGTCQIALDEALFDGDHPGHYFRRLRSVVLTIPCVVGPYTGVNATLSLTNAMIRTQAPGSSYAPQSATAAPVDSSVISSPTAAAGTTTIATSSGQNDAGLFDVNLRDERWLPFEGQGAISTWNLSLDPRDNDFDFTTITDVVLHLRYTARGGGDQTAANNVRAALKAAQSQASRSILVSARNTFGNAYYTFFNPTDPAAGQQLTLPFSTNLFPFSNLGTGSVTIESIAFYVVLSAAASGNTIAASFNPSGQSPVAGSLALEVAPGQTTAGNGLSALTASVSPAATVTPSAPQSFTVTVPPSSVPAGLASTVAGTTLLDPNKVEDVLLVITYTIH